MLKDSRRAICAILLCILALCSCRKKTDLADAEEAPAMDGVKLKMIASGFTSPVYITAPAGDSRLFIVDQPGVIHIVKNGSLLSRPFLNIKDRVAYGGERGLLSLAFHPKYSENGFFYVNYTRRPDGHTHVERYSATPDSDEADPASQKLILMVEQPHANHNGGHIQFGPDGMLYIGMGDGGSAGDPHNHGQDRSTLLGDLLRIDVDGGDPYSIPADNPFSSQPGMRPEIWAWGLRNPWRFAFDAPSGLLYIADVGQNRYEEIHVAPISQGGLNYGWRIMEGKHCYRSETCSSEGLVLPATEYGHSQGCSITGGYVYRGKAIPNLDGQYFYADYCLGWIKSFRYINGEISVRKTWKLGVESNVLSFGLDSAGELYVCFSNGKVYKFVPA
jgi:glucose/arabinose dehydrogenase